MADEAYSFDEEGARRIVRAVRRLEGMPGNDQPTGQTRGHVRCTKFLCKNSGSTWAKGTTRDVNTYTGTQGSETDSGVTLTAVYNRMGDIAASAWVYVEDIGGKLEALTPEC